MLRSQLFRKVVKPSRPGPSYNKWISEGLALGIIHSFLCLLPGPLRCELAAAHSSRRSCELGCTWRVAPVQNMSPSKSLPFKLLLLYLVTATRKAIHI